ncbi:MAG TPA: glycosyltransferase family 4 protein, partial [Bacteroidota bacterium]|nr:glycosyltransferase family 4 protein [Bacteroidota bacterium]
MKNSPQKNVVIALPILLLGGTEIHTLSLIRVLVARGYRVTVCCYYEYRDSTVKEYESAGANVLLLKRKRNIAGRANAGELLSLLISLRAVFSGLKPDILHVQYVAPGFIPILAARMAGVKTVVATVHTAGEIAYGSTAKKVLRMSAMLCSNFICVSQSAGAFWFGRCDIFDPSSSAALPRHLAIYNGVNVQAIQKAISPSSAKRLRRELHIGKKKVIGIIGRVVDMKGHRVLLDAMQKVIEENPDTVLVVVGDGPIKETLEHKAEILGIGSHVRWLGEQSLQKVYEILGIIDVLAVPSFFEGFGLTAAEAMAAAVPVVANNIAGLNEVVLNDITGLLVQPGEPSQLAQAILRMLEKPREARKMGQAGRTRAQNLFSLKNFERSYS